MPEGWVISISDAAAGGSLTPSVGQAFVAGLWPCLRARNPFRPRGSLGSRAGAICVREEEREKRQSLGVQAGWRANS